eukprot:scaffold4395_cov123-Isochrysis_galbana.AAC.9
MAAAVGSAAANPRVGAPLQGKGHDGERVAGGDGPAARLRRRARRTTQGALPKQPAPRTERLGLVTTERAPARPRPPTPRTRPSLPHAFRALGQAQGSRAASRLNALAVERGAERLEVRLNLGHHHADQIVGAEGEQCLDDIVGKRVVQQVGEGLCGSQLLGHEAHRRLHGRAGGKGSAGEGGTVGR